MKPQSRDTSPEVERVLIDLYRKASPEKRFAIFCSWSQTLLASAKEALRREHPHASEEELKLLFVARYYGQEIADALRGYVSGGKKRVSTMMNMPDMVQVLTTFVDALERLGIDYYFGGSVASAMQGFVRATLDADLVVDLHMEQVHPLVEALKDEYYIDEDMIKDALRSRSTFNIIHLDTMFKIDVFLPKSRPFDQEVRRRVEIGTLASSRPFRVASPEDLILNKLEWYKMGSNISDHQWHDVVGTLKMKGTAIDLVYLRKWAAELRVSDLFERALAEAGLNS